LALYREERFPPRPRWKIDFAAHSSLFRGFSRATVASIIPNLRASQVIIKLITLKAEAERIERSEALPRLRARCY
jgi:hypothetical protein